MPVLLFNPLTAARDTSQVEANGYVEAKPRAIHLLLLSVVIVLFHGYHPNSQDSAIYTSSAERVMNSSLFQIDGAFVDGHTRLSIFPHLLAATASILHISLGVVQLICYWFTGLLFLYACQQLAERVFNSSISIWFATLLSGICSTMPVAATSLLLMDPYLTARSFSTPFSLLALVSCIDRSWRRSALWAGLTLSFHPLMGTYLCLLLFTFVLIDPRRFKAALGYTSLALLFFTVVSFFSRQVPISDAYRTAALSRSYYFLSCWHWYEVMGIAAPTILMAVVAARSRITADARKLAAACALTGFVASLVSICFVSTKHPDFLMRLQVLRSFQMVYGVGLVFLGGFIGTLGTLAVRNHAILLIPVVAMGIADWQAYPGTHHIEWPWQRAGNPRQEAYKWIADNTPPDAVFASDTAVKRDPEEEGFRSITKRSTLNDAKDEGIASLFPSVAPVWAKWRDAQYGLNHLTDQDRETRLRPLGVTWILLPPNSRTLFPCPYRNSELAACRITR